MSNNVNSILNYVSQGLQGSSPVSNLLLGAQNAQALQGNALRNQLLQNQVGLAPLQRQALEQDLAAQQQQMGARELQMDEAQAEKARNDLTRLAQDSMLVSEERRAQFIRNGVADLDMIGQPLAQEIEGMDDTELLGAASQLAGVREKPRFDAVKVDTDNGLVVYTNSATGDTVTKPIGDFRLGDMSPADRREFQKETRSSLRKDRDNTVKRARELSSSREKIQSLIADAAKGNRGSIGAVIMNLAKLNSPGVVTDQDFATVAGAGDPVAEALSLLMGKGFDVDSVLRGIDPTNPDNFNASQVIETANSLITSQVPGIQEEIAAYRERAKIAELPGKQIDTIFSGLDFVDSITPITAPKGISKAGQSITLPNGVSVKKVK